MRYVVKKWHLVLQYFVPKCPQNAGTFQRPIFQIFSGGACPLPPPPRAKQNQSVITKCDVIFDWHTKIPRSAPGCVCMSAMFFSLRIKFSARKLLPFPRVCQGCSPVSYSLFTPPSLSLATTFHSVIRGPWFGGASRPRRDTTAYSVVATRVG